MTAPGIIIIIIIIIIINLHNFAFSALTLLVGWQEGHPTRKKWGMVEVGAD